MYFHKPQEKPRRWGSFQDVQYAIRVNSEKIYDCNPDNDVLVMPGFWGLPPLDYSGKNNHGTNYGATYKDRSLDFNGSSDYVEVNHHSSIDFDTDENFSILLWFKTTANAQKEMIEKQEGEVFYQLRSPHSVENNKIRIQLDDGTDPQTAVYSATTNLNDDIWHHVVVVREYGIDLTMYIDGIYDNAYGSDPTISIANNANLFIGKGNSGYFNGFIDEVRISNVVHTADQIALFYDRPWALYQPVSRPVYFLPSIEAIMNQFQKSNLGSDLFNGALL